MALHFFKIVYIFDSVVLIFSALTAILFRVYLGFLFCLFIAYLKALYGFYILAALPKASLNKLIDFNSR